MDYKFKKIMIGFDNSASSIIALDKALEFCKAFDTGLYLVNVKDPKANGNDHTEMIRLHATDSGVEINYMERSGHVNREISAVEREIGADLIFMGSHGLNGFQPYWIGSNAIRVVSASSCPVITIQADSGRADFTDIILPLDNSDETRQKVPYAAVLAKVFNSTIHILSVSKDTNEATKQKITIYARQTEKYLDKFEIKYTSELRVGHSVAQTCIDYAIERKAGLIMMMTETENNSWYMGTVAQQLINHSPVPVLSIHSRDLFHSGASGY